MKTIKNVILVVFFVLSIRPALADGRPDRDLMILTLTFTSGGPSGVSLPISLTEILELTQTTRINRVIESTVGDLVPGVTATPGLGGWVSLDAPFGNGITVKFVALLSIGGKFIGRRVTLIRMDISQSGVVTGRCRIDTQDLDGNLVWSANGIVDGKYIDVDSPDNFFL